MAFSTEMPVPAQDCPVCGHHLDSMVNLIDPVMAKPDDWAICNYCGAVAKYDGLMRMRRLKPDEQRFADRSKVITAASATIRARRGIT